MACFTTHPHHGWRIYDAASGDFLGGAFVKAAPHDVLPWNDVLPLDDEEEPWYHSPLRTVFGFDGCVGPSLRDVLAALEAAPPETVVTTESLCKDRYLMVVA